MKTMLLMAASLAAAGWAGADQFVVGGTEDQATYPFAGC
jgi:hypothetical protein